MTRNRLRRLLTALACLLAGCRPAPDHFATPFVGKTKLTKAQALDLAKKAARVRGIDLSEYENSDATIDSPGKSWYISFYRKGPAVAVGDHFGVEVTDSTGATEFVPGA